MCNCSFSKYGFLIKVLLFVLQIIERSLPKKQKVKKDPSVIEREEMEKIGKVWVNIVRRDMPKHHRNFTAFHRKQLIDAKRVSENCQREASKHSLSEASHISISSSILESNF